MGKKKKLLEWLKEARSHMSRLSVILQWARMTEDIHQAAKVVAYLQGQRYCFSNVVRAIEDVHRQMSYARLRSPDLSTALSVLSLGTVARFPTQNTRQFNQVMRLQPPTILHTLRELDTIISLQLSLHAALPEPWYNYEVKSGRARFFMEEQGWYVDLAMYQANGRWFFVDIGKINSDHEKSEINFQLDVKKYIEGISNDVLGKSTDPSSFPLYDLYLFYESLHASMIYESLLSEADALARASARTGAVQLKQVPNGEQTGFDLFYWQSIGKGQQQPLKENKISVRIVLEPLPTKKKEYMLPPRVHPMEKHSKVDFRWVTDDNEAEIPGLPLQYTSILVADLLDRATRAHADRTIKRIIQDMPNEYVSTPSAVNILEVTCSLGTFTLRVDLTTGSIVVSRSLLYLDFDYPHQLIETSLNNSLTRTGKLTAIFQNCLIIGLKRKITRIASAIGLRNRIIPDSSVSSSDTIANFGCPPTFLLYFDLPFWNYTPMYTYNILIKVMLSKSEIWLAEVRHSNSQDTFWKFDTIERLPFQFYPVPTMSQLQPCIRYATHKFTIIRCMRCLEARNIGADVLYPPQSESQEPLQLRMCLLSFKSSSLQSTPWLAQSMIFATRTRKDDVYAILIGAIRGPSFIDGMLKSIWNYDVTFNVEHRIFQLAINVSQVPLETFFSKLKQMEGVIQLQTKALSYSSRSNVRLVNRDIQKIVIEYGEPPQEMEIESFFEVDGISYRASFPTVVNPHNRFKRFVNDALAMTVGNIGTVAEVCDLIC